MNKTSNQSHQRANNFNIEHFRIRLTARLGIILVCLLLYVQRIPAVIANSTIHSRARMFAWINLAFPLLMTLIIIFEYFLFKRMGAKIVKHTTIVDIILLLVFLADWIILLLSNLNKIQQTDPVCFQVGAIFGFTSFSWRTLLMTLIIQKWQLKIIPPAVATMTTVGYAIHYSPETLAFTLLSGIVQLLNVIIIIYCDDKVKWNIVWANIQKDKWMQVNNFILNSIPENIMILDLQGETKFISESCQSFLKNCNLPLETKELFKRIQGLQQQKYDPSLQTERMATYYELLGENENHHIRDQTLEEIVNHFKNNIIRNEINEKQFQVYNGKLKIDENQQEKSLEVKISFVQHFENSYIILILRDTTQRDLLVTLEETNKYKDQLLASVSHELRAPLNGNINLVESAINSPKIPENLKQSLLIPAIRSSKFLLHMINDILDMSQIKEKKLRLVFNPENLKETLKSTAQLIELQAKKKGIELLVDIDPAIPKTFSTDHIRLSQIVLNLLNNGIKFTKEGTVKLTAKNHFCSSCVQISVEDSGIGMTKENVQKLFSSYTHIEFEGRHVMNPTGVGLGLNIAYNLAILLGPDNQQGISVTSIPGQGSNFTFIIENKGEACGESQNSSYDGIDKLAQPVEIPRMQRISSGISSSMIPIIERCDSDPRLNNNSCRCPKILVVDDNPFNTMACEAILSSLEVKCASVYCGSACIKTLLDRQTKTCGDKCKQFAVVFMDQEMPEMSGSDTVCEIRRLQKANLLSPDLNIIGCTAHRSKEEVEKFFEAGINRCIHKPISAVMIKDILKETAAFEK